MSKYTRLNKITHYHDSGSKNQNQLGCKAYNNNNNNNNSNSTSSTSSALLSSTTNIELTGHIIPSSNLILREEHSPLTDRISGSRINCGKMMANHQHKHQLYHNCNSNSKGYATKKSNCNKLAFFVTITILLIVSLAGIRGVYSLNCYHCSSVDNPGCDESFSGRANMTETDCEKSIGRPAKVCRKIVQYIESKKVVIRSCGYIDDHDEKDRKAMCNKRSGTFAIMMESCNCYTDNCNHSASLVPNQSVLLTTVSLTTFAAAILLYSKSQCSLAQR